MIFLSSIRPAVSACIVLSPYLMPDFWSLNRPGVSGHARDRASLLPFPESGEKSREKRDEGGETPLKKTDARRYGRAGREGKRGIRAASVRPDRPAGKRPERRETKAKIPAAGCGRKIPCACPVAVRSACSPHPGLRRLPVPVRCRRWKNARQEPDLPARKRRCCTLPPP